MVKTESGQSLVAVLVSVAVAGILMAAITTMTTNMQREVQALTEKLAALDLQKTAVAALADGSVCKFLLPATSVTFNAGINPTAANPIKIQVPGNRLYASVSGTAPGPVITGPVIAEAGVAPSGLTNNLQVTNMELELFNKAGTTFTGNFVINFDNNRLIRPIRPVKVLVGVTASSAGAGATVASCMGVAGGGGGGSGQGGDLCGAFTSSGTLINVVAKCHGHTPPCGSFAKFTNVGCPVTDRNTLCPTGYTATTISDVPITTQTSTGGYGAAGSVPQTNRFMTISCVKN